jgi:hypothetical protein
MTASREYRDSLAAALRDLKEATAYVHAALEAGDRAAYLLAIDNLTKLKDRPHRDLGKRN